MNNVAYFADRKSLSPNFHRTIANTKACWLVYGVRVNGEHVRLHMTSDKRQHEASLAHYSLYRASDVNRVVGVKLASAEHVAQFMEGLTERDISRESEYLPRLSLWVD